MLTETWIQEEEFIRTLKVKLMNGPSRREFHAL